MPHVYASCDILAVLYAVQLVNALVMLLQDAAIFVVLTTSAAMLMLSYLAAY